MPRRGRVRKKSQTYVDETKTAAALAPSGEQQQDPSGAASGLKIPKSIVVKHGKTMPEVADLVSNLRHMMMPYTALNLHEHPSWTLKHYVQHLALPMGVSHIMSVRQNDERVWLRLSRIPHGPTLTFRIQQFSVHKHIAALQKRPFCLSTPALHANPPLVVTHNFESSTPTTSSSTSSSSPLLPHVKLMRITFQNLFPATNVATVPLTSCRRVVLFHYDAHREVIDMRHFAIMRTNTTHTTRTSTTTTLSTTHSNKNNSSSMDDDTNPNPPNDLAAQKRLEKLLQKLSANSSSSSSSKSRSRSKLPNLSRHVDIADYIEHGGGSSGGGYASDASQAFSDSEAEELDDFYGNDQDNDSTNTSNASSTTGALGGNRTRRPKNIRSALKLRELGPRLTLQLIKVEQGLGLHNNNTSSNNNNKNNVLYHALIQKSPQEAAALQARKEQERQLKQQRRDVQAANVERKKKENNNNCKRPRLQQPQRNATDKPTANDIDAPITIAANNENEEESIEDNEPSDKNSNDEDMSKIRRM